MKRLITSALALAACTFMATGAAVSADKPDEITVAYFLEWPTANQVAQLEETYDKEMGIKVNWRAFGNGNEMSQAMASGDVQIAYSQGLVPYVVAVSNGLPLKLIGVAVSYAEADNCVVSKDSGITKENAKELEGKKIGTPIGNVTHYKLLRMLDHLGVDATKVQMVQMNGADAAVAFARGDIVMGCAFGGPMLRMKETGEYLMTAEEQEAIGIRVFDVISVTDEFATDHPDLVQKFMDVTDAANSAYYADKVAAVPSIAKAAGMDKGATENMLGMFAFPSKTDQASDAWLGGTVQTFTKEVADFFVSQKQMDKALPSYDAVITDKFVK
jgi:taurine transport system substrate-binding protein